MSPDDPSPSFFAKLFGRAAPQSENISPQEFADKSTELSKDEMVDAAERFHILSVQDVMVPRANIVAAPTTASLKELTQTFKDAGHSRLPVYKDTLDEPLGMVHIKDVLPYLLFNAKGRTAKGYPNKKIIMNIKRPVLFVPPSMLCLLYTSPSPRDKRQSRMPSSA